ncbi:box C/D snoRNA protein 1 isoform X2 [Dromiciops gliroides]|uniref:box C/D snoRNA protein 1 isoform X2 n=1 Tax=Dromiciops gliroides TaxID=33562 RepID=UPI001CC52B4E|nr:box C/D snoRNA protein 1 isoform X2 [Dromiciops gliroides]
MAEARGGDSEPGDRPGTKGMGLKLKLEPEGGGLEVKLELAGGVEAKVEWDGLQIKVEVMEEPEELVEVNPAGLEVKQELMEEPEVKEELMEAVEVKQELVEGVEVEEVMEGPEVKQELVDDPEVKQELAEGVDMKEELMDGVDVKEEFLDGLEAMKEVVDRLQVKEEMLDLLEEGIPGMSRVEVMVGEMGTEEAVAAEETGADGTEVKEEEEMIDGRNIKEERMEVKLEVKEEEEGELEVKEEDGVEVKTEVDGVEVKNEGLKEEVMDRAEATEEQEPPREPRVGSKRKLALSSCEICGIEEAKYRCPRCMKCSCSLACVKKHKTELTCNGIREKTAFVSLKQFTEINLLSDYRFLEDVGRSADYIARDIFLKRPSTNRILNYMKNRARRHNIDLRILPIGFTKRRENSTVFDRKEQRFYWHLKLLFPQSHAEYVEKGVPDDKKLHEILRTYIDPEKSDPVIRQRLKAYVFSESGIQILMKIENMQHNLIRYYELDPCKSLIDNLKDKVVIEYPTLHVVLKGSKNDMIILGQERTESTESFGSENPVLSSEEEGEIQESS